MWQWIALLIALLIFSVGMATCIIGVRRVTMRGRCRVTLLLGGRGGSYNCSTWPPTLVSAKLTLCCIWD